ncbi:polysaccharide export outer membrane protein [Prosthecobacter debontii]|uniref:Polysaccharide export outer membrane protein n=1 Tax=Prosthecobacter debontii TaxID=48467 RepID=A0A1T4WVM4_9BACT|nr:polysaccharide biosynthesis/export family protein [Prosthecobacter debontii]SKA81299.1 polysaccharide export outer membrane protein [Prosthecobacter debontii]
MKTIFVLLVSLLTLQQLWAQSGELPLRPGDRITISVGAIPDNEVAQIKGVYTVSDNGTINLLHIGEVRASGLKPSALQRAIEQTYIREEIYTRPNVLVSIDSVGGADMRQVTVTGVVKPGGVPYQQGMTLSRAIMSAGGPTPFGSMKKVKLLRGGRASVHNLSTGIGNPNVDVLVQPDDQIIVPE